MTASGTLELDGVPYPVDKAPDRWTIVLRRSIALVRDVAELDLLEHGHDTLMPCRVTCEPDRLTMELDPGDGTLGWADVRRLPRAERLRALMNVAACVELVDRGCTVVLDPVNVVVDRNLRPRLAYRGLRGAMPPRDAGHAHVLRQYQALVLSTTDPSASFTELVGGATTLRRSSPFERAVVAAASVPELAEYLTRLYDETLGDDARRLVRVGRRSHAVSRHAAIWLGVAAVGAGAVALTSTFVSAPFDARMLEADRRFVATDYDGVIETLRPVPAHRLPLTQRYTLAYSFLRGTNLSDAQRTAIENALSLSSDPDYLTYWVATGRGDLEDALDLAKKLDDIDLVLYALTLLQEQVRSDGSLDGAQRESRLEELQAEYDRYLEARATAVADGTADAGGEPGEIAADGTTDGGAAEGASGPAEIPVVDEPEA